MDISLFRVVTVLEQIVAVSVELLIDNASLAQPSPDQSISTQGTCLDRKVPACPSAQQAFSSR